METLKKVFSGEFDSHVLPFVWLHGESEEVIVEYIEKIAESNIKEMCIESRPHPDFLGSGWWRDLDIIVREAKKRDMKIWILDDVHFPTGYANGLIEDKYPERAKKLLTHRVINTIGPNKHVGINTMNLMDPKAKVLSVYAKQGDTIIDLNEVRGDKPVFFFSAPEGNWSVFILYETQNGDFLPYYINMVDKQSCDTLIEAVYEPHYERYKEEFGKTIAGFFSDEPGFMNEKGVNNDSSIGKNMPLPWSAELKEILIERLGENYHLKLSSLWSKDSNSAEVRFVFMDCCTKLYKKNFSENIGNWCRKRDVMYIGHIIEDRDSNARLGVGAGHFYRSMAGQDMAGIDIVLNQLVPGLDEGEQPTIRGTWDAEFFHYCLGKMGSSLARIDPLKKDRTVAEVFGAYGWHEGVKLMKWLIDHFLIRGVNYFVPHAFSLKAFPDVDCPPHFYARGHNPQFKYFGDLMAYTNKMATLLSNSKQHINVAILYHAEAEWTGEYMLPQKVTKILTQNQVDFDIIPNDVFENQAYFKTHIGKVMEVNNKQYDLLIVPYMENISKELIDFINQAQGSDLRVLFINELPVNIYNGSNEKLEFLKENTEVIALNELHLQLGSINKNYKINHFEPFLRVASFEKEDSNFFMVFNEHPINVIKNYLTLDYEGPIYRYDVLNNEIIKIDQDEKKRIPLILNPYESFLYILGHVDESLIKLDKTDRFMNEMQLDRFKKLSVSSSKTLWKYEEIRNVATFTNLSELSQLSNVSGTFRYEIEFELNYKVNMVEIDLGDVFEVAEVYVNGKLIGSKICPPYTFCCSEELKSGINIVTVDVTNTLDKEVPDYFSTGQPVSPSGIVNNVIIRY